MLRKFTTVAFCAIAALGLVLAPGAAADIDDTSADNGQEGDNSGRSKQKGDAESGRPRAGQDVRVESSGPASVAANNRTDNVRVRSGDAEGSNGGNHVAGQVGSASTSVDLTTDIRDVLAVNVQEGDNTFRTEQLATAVVGDAIAGQLLGVTSGVTAELTAVNITDFARVRTGDALPQNRAATVAGLTAVTGTVTLSSDISGVTADNVQEGDNRVATDQDAVALAGSGIAGQYGAALAHGDAAISGENVTRNSSVKTGTATAFNNRSAVAGLTTALDLQVSAPLLAAIGPLNGTNVHEGNNRSDLGQFAEGTVGDAIGGQVLNAISRNDGASAFARNVSVIIDLEVGTAFGVNRDSTVASNNASTGSLVVGSP